MEEPKLAKRRSNKKSTIMSGRTIGEKRERLETRNERAAARKKDKKKAARRVFFTILGFVMLGVAAVLVARNFIVKNEPEPIAEQSEPIPEYRPTIEIIDEDSSAAEGKITSRMESFIGKLERDFKDLGYRPAKAVIPTGSIREVDFYLEDFFDRATYGDIQLPNIAGIPSYAELKKSSTWANSIKSRIQRHKKENTLSPSDYLGFEAFLDQLVSAFGF